MTDSCSAKKEPGLSPEAATDLVMWLHVMQSVDSKVNKILRLHALSESYLDRALELRLSKPQYVLDNGRFTYHQKYCVARALGAFPDRVFASLKKLSSLRNICAHSPIPKVSDDQIVDAAKPIGVAYKNAIADSATDGRSIEPIDAYSWALFTELSLAVAPYEFAKAQLAI